MRNLGWNRYRKIFGAAFLSSALALAQAGCASRETARDGGLGAGTVSGGGSLKGTEAKGEPGAGALSGQGGAGPSLLTVSYDAEDLEDTWREDACTYIRGSDGGVEIDGQGAAADGMAVTVSQPGVYVLSGTFEEGQVRVDAGKEDVVRLVLNGVSLSNSRTAPIYGLQCGKLVLTLAEGTENEVRDGAEYQYGEEGQDEPDAPIFCQDDLTVNGNGGLTVEGSYDHGIHSKDDLKIVSGTIDVKAAGDGVKGKDSVAVKGGTLTVDAAGDGIQSNHDTDAQKGYVLLEGGDFHIAAGKDGIQAETVLEICGGTYDIVTGQGFSGEARQDSESRKGLKAGATLRIAGGEFRVDSEDDAVHANGDVVIAGDEMELKSGDDGIHADSNVTVEDGKIAIAHSYEGIEGTTLDLCGGTIDLKAADDGLNAAGGRDGSGAGGGRDRFAAEEDAYIRISGGSLTIDAAGDGLDSNGHLYLEGGDVYVSGPEDGRNGILDFNGDALVSGGTFIGMGSSGMFQACSDASAQNMLVVFYPEELEAGTEVQVLDGKGGMLASATALKRFDALLVSAPGLKSGESVTVRTGGEEQLIALDGVITQSGERAQGLDSPGFPGQGHEPPQGRGRGFAPDGGVSGNGIQSGDRPGRPRRDSDDPPGGRVLPDGQEPSDDQEPPAGKSQSLGKND